MMVQLTFGDKDQLRFNDQAEFFTTLGFCCNSKIVSISYEPNKKTGSYADAYRIRILTQAKDIPDVLQRAITTGNRINCNKYVEYLIKNFGFIQNGSKVYGVLENVIESVPSDYISSFIAGYKNHTNIQTTKGFIVFETEEIVKNISRIQKTSIPKKTNKKTNSKTKKTSGKKKIDYIKKQIDDVMIGNVGEELVFKYECKKIEKLSQKDPDFKNFTPKWISLKDDTIGYDILSYNEKKEKIFIEVKSTKADKYANFYISKNEIEFSKHHSENYYLYRVFGLSTTKNFAKFYVLNGDISKSMDIEQQETVFIAKLKP